MRTGMERSDFFERNRAALRRVKRIFCGFSGGADSTSLLLFLQKEADRIGFKLKAVHFEHGLRGRESAEDSIWCARFCENRKIDFMEINLDVRNSIRGSESFEDTARRFRLREWKTLCSEDGDAVALGHNSDDRNENMLIRLLRGSNVSGLSSLREIQKIDGVTIIRPLLSYSRAQIEEFLSLQDVDEWREDSSNADNEILRNHIRNVIISELADICDGAREGMRRAAEALQEDAIYIEGEAEKAFSSLLAGKSHGPTLPLQPFMELPRAIRIRILRRWIGAEEERDYVPGYELLARLEDAGKRISSLKDKNRIKVPLPNLGGAFLDVSPSEIAFAKIAEPMGSVEWNWRKTPRIKWGRWRLDARILTGGKVPVDLKTEDDLSALFDPALIPSTLTIGPAFEGDKMTPFGGKGEVRLKKLFEGRKIPSKTKSSYPVLRIPGSGPIIWVGAVRRSSYAPVGKNCRSLKIKMEAISLRRDGAKKWIHGRGSQG